MIKQVIISYEHGLMNIQREYEADHVWEQLCKYFLFLGADTTGYELKKAFEKAYKNLLNSNGEKNDDLEVDLEDVFFKVFKKFSIKAKKKHIRELGIIYQILTTESVAVNKDMLKVIDYCMDNNIDVQVIANGQLREIKNELKAAGISEKIEFVWNSSTSGLKKPNPEMLEKLMKGNDFKKKEILYISTNYEIDLKMAGEIGLKTALLNNENKHVDCAGDIEAILEYLKA